MKLGREIGPHLGCERAGSGGAVTTTVVVEALIIDAFMGVHRHEHFRRQPLVISAELGVGRVSEDVIEATFDYCLVETFARELAQKPFTLIETFAHALGRRCLLEGAENVCLVVGKPEALGNGRASVVVRMSRRPASDAPYGES